jgi:cytochrome o ubiquinol oxidase subunit 2
MIEKLLQKAARIGRFMTTRRLAGLAVLVLVIAAMVVGILLVDSNIAVLNPKGVIATKQFNLIIFTTLLGLTVVIPVLILLFAFAFRYRDGRKKPAKYDPDMEGNRLLELVWWGIPILIILILSVVTWITTHDLDPYKKLSSDKQSINVKVIALQWKWLFLYEGQEVATVNELRIPEDTPINFDITSDAPMSAFWIPNLGSQTYAMNGMSSKLHLQADEVGEYPGYNTNINGEGYAKMRFKAIVTTRAEFDRWAREIAVSDNHLDWDMYEELAKPSQNNQVEYFMLHDPALYNKVMAKYMDHGSATTDAGIESSDTLRHEGMHH